MLCYAFASTDHRNLDPTAGDCNLPPMTFDIKPPTGMQTPPASTPGEEVILVAALRLLEQATGSIGSKLSGYNSDDLNS